MNRDWLRPLGETGLVVSAIGAGAGPLGNLPGSLGRDVGADEGVATVRRILAGPISFLDTSNSYGGGKSDRIASTLVGFSRPERVDEIVRLAEWPIPEELWGEVERHVPAPANWLW
jgi:aryl-alcohol dehydrogenase-like predicted oxidoreductase